MHSSLQSNQRGHSLFPQWNHWYSQWWNWVRRLWFEQYWSNKSLLDCNQTFNRWKIRPFPLPIQVIHILIYNLFLHNMPCWEVVDYIHKIITYKNSNIIHRFGLKSTCVTLHLQLIFESTQRPKYFILCTCSSVRQLVH